jgi:hypothetical protein
VLRLFLFCAIIMACAGVSAEEKQANAALVPEVSSALVKPDANALAEAKPAPAENALKIRLAPGASDDDGKPQVRLVAVETDIARRYSLVVPPLPIYPFSVWRRWIHEHEKACHCALEWRDENGVWFHGELRSMSFEKNIAQYRVGTGEFPGTAYHAYGVYILPGRVLRTADAKGQPVNIMYDEKIDCDYKLVELEIRKYGAKYAQPGDPGTGGKGEYNVGLGGPAYKPAQNSNTMINYVLRACGVEHSAPPMAVGWDTVPSFPYSSEADR